MHERETVLHKYQLTKTGYWWILTAWSREVKDAPWRLMWCGRCFINYIKALAAFNTEA